MNVVITGASKGLGREMAMQFAAGGHDLVLISRNSGSLAEAAAAISMAFPSVQVQYKPYDLSLTDQVQDAGDWILSLTSAPDVLVNNAGQFIPGSVHNEPEGSLEQMIAVNLYSAYHLTRKVIPAMISRKTGHVFNICSIASFQAYANGGAYSISKFALAGFSKNLREEMKPHGIKVTAVYPGAAFTDSWAGSGVDPQRIMESSDVARMVVAAASLSVQACVEDIILRPQLGDL